MREKDVDFEIILKKEWLKIRFLKRLKIKNRFIIKEFSLDYIVRSTITLSENQFYSSVIRRKYENEIISIIIFNLLLRTIIVFFASSILVLLRIITPSEALSFVNWDAITLLFGMFTLVITLKGVNFLK